jgi:hypothetical protein
MIAQTTVAVLAVVQMAAVAILCVDKLLSLLWYIVFCGKRTMLVYASCGALLFLFLEKLFQIIRNASPDFIPPFVYQWAFVICAWQILTVVLTDYCFLLKALVVQRYPKILTAFFVWIAVSRSICIFCAYYFSLVRFWDRQTWLENDYPTLRLRFDTAANILGLAYNLVMSLAFIYEIAKSVRSKQGRLHTILVSEQISLITSLFFETSAVVIMLSTDSYLVFVISDVARAVKTFTVPCQLIQTYIKQENGGSSSSMKTSEHGPTAHVSNRNKSSLGV